MAKTSATMTVSCSTPPPQAPVFTLFKHLATLSVVAFLASSYILVLSPEHKWQRSLDNNSFTTVQATAFGVACVSVVFLLGFTGVTFVGIAAKEETPYNNDQWTKTAKKTDKNVFTFGDWVCFVSTTLSTLFVLYKTILGVAVFVKQGMKYPSPIGLFTGIASVAVGQVAIIVYHFFRREIFHPEAITVEGNKQTAADNVQLVQKNDTIQKKPLKYHINGYLSEIYDHFAREEAFFLLLPYLSITWMLNLMPESYYNMDGPVEWHKVIFKLLVVDYFTFTNHVTEHRIPSVYKRGHKPHHRFTNPQIFNAFNGSLMDTIVLILLPLFTTANLVHLNTWSYVAFGTSYASYFMLIHSEFPHVFDPFMKAIGVYTAEDHHVHHALFVYNYSHFFTYFDRLFGTYKCGNSIKTFRSHDHIMGRGEIKVQ